MVIYQWIYHILTFDENYTLQFCPEPPTIWLDDEDDDDDGFPPGTLDDDC